MATWCQLRSRISVGLVLCGCVIVMADGFSVAAQTLAQRIVAEKVAGSGELLDINTAMAAQLKALPGMGDAYAARIIAGRPYTAKNQLTMRGILPVAAYDQIKLLIVAHRPKRQAAEMQ